MLRYRVVVRASDQYPYKVQEYHKFLFLGFWADVPGTKGIHASLEEAKIAIQQIIKTEKALEKLPGGKVVYEYDENDLLVDKLKGK